MNNIRLEKGHGVFIVFEGGDGAGKTTAIDHVVNYLGTDMKYDVVRTREPGGTPFAEAVRNLMFNRELSGDINNTAAALLMNAARSDHVHRVIDPAIEAGKVVICDRFFLSTMMYQRKAELMRIINMAGSNYLQPALTIILDVDPETGMRRKQTQGDVNHLDERSLEDKRMQREVYLAYAKANPMSTVVIDGNASKDNVLHTQLHAVITQRILPLLSRRIVSGE